MVVEIRAGRQQRNPVIGGIHDLQPDRLDAPSIERHAEQLAGLRNQLAARAGHDVVADLPSITQPTLVCAGRYDDIAPMENSELLATRIPGARLQVFEGGHFFMIQDRSAFPTIIEFLARIEKGES